MDSRQSGRNTRKDTKRPGTARSKLGRPQKRRLENIRKAAPSHYLIVCEGTKTEPLYFGGISNHINSRYPNRIQLDIYGTGRSTLSLVRHTQKLVNQSAAVYDSVWVVFDKDDFSDEQFNGAIELAHSEGFRVGWSNEAVELWFLLHFEYLIQPIPRGQYLTKLTQHFTRHHLNPYRKNQEDIYDILRTYGSITKAISNAKRLLKRHTQRSKTELYPSGVNPGTNLYELVEDLLEYLETIDPFCAT